jgi:hypothetical protein
MNPASQQLAYKLPVGYLLVSNKTQKPELKEKWYVECCGYQSNPGIGAKVGN